jgi:putative endonuclease
MTRRFIPTSEWQDERQLRGLEGEMEALAYLTSCGWQVEAHRFRLGRHDVDLIVRRGQTVAFVEVKTRRSTAFGEGIEAIGWRKQRSIARTASLWALRHGRAGDEYRFDVVQVRRQDGKWVVEHLADAFRPRESLI